MSSILDFGKENILEFIQKKIKHSNSVEKDIIDKITYVSGPIYQPISLNFVQNI